MSAKQRRRELRNRVNRLAGMARNIRLLRYGAGMSEKEFAQIFNPPVHQSAVSRWELGKDTPRAMKVAAIADYFQVTMDTIYGRQPMPTHLVERYFRMITEGTDGSNSAG